MPGCAAACRLAGGFGTFWYVKSTPMHGKHLLRATSRLYHRHADKSC